MKVQEVVDKLNKLIEETPDAKDWEVYLEVEDLYTFNESTVNHNGVLNEDMIEQNKKTIHRVKNAMDSYWKFVTVKDDDTTQYYKECFGGISSHPEKRAVLFSIHV